MKIGVFYLGFCVLHTFASSATNKEVFIQMTPSRSQFFQYERVSLSCDVSAGGSRLRRNTTTRGTESCPYGWGTLNGSTCTITTLYVSDTGLYWCESESGDQSQTVHITVTAGPVILDSPALPVMERDTVTLSCTNRKTSSANLTADFYKDGVFIGSSSTGNMTIHSVSPSDEGLYRCNVSGAGGSADSWLTVRDPAAPDAPDAPDAPVMSVSRLVCHVIVGTPYLLSTIILGLIYRDRRAGQLVAEDRRHDVIMEVE
ncbi:basement membrane-specific heparan sulfate proteoglycan core protein-like isoform X2 [Epinephelus fuscoguttatus]|uniref:basement membrane-specific heparan sulfate proteoglycan core protein-like isoform X2 n=1 Tax=Epinephelus fuscoguttatus TaxID=293821 RepID=UPI0020D00417|nr:basement membrane-specific heparan sulfate proteoglycan core protein-like isoform X2 [Epinephelus fuscoguttatus]